MTSEQPEEKKGNDLKGEAVRAIFFRCLGHVWLEKKDSC
jgi:hypothetical protein